MTFGGGPFIPKVGIKSIEGSGLDEGQMGLEKESETGVKGGGRRGEVHSWRADGGWRMAEGGGRRAEGRGW